MYTDYSIPNTIYNPMYNEKTLDIILSDFKESYKDFISITMFDSYFVVKSFNNLE